MMEERVRCNSEIVFCLIFVSKPYNFLTGHGLAGLKKINVPGPRAVYGLDFAGYERFGPKTLGPCQL